MGAGMTATQTLTDADQATVEEYKALVQAGVYDEVELQEFKEMLSGDTVGGMTACYFGRHVSTDAGQSNLAHVCDGVDNAFFNAKRTALPEFQALVLQPQMEVTNVFALIDK